MAAVEIIGALSDADYQRGYVCVAPNRTCGVSRSITDNGVWFRTSALGLWQSAHLTCAKNR